jgi:hypothetical protein
MEEAAASASQILEEAGFTVVRRESGEISATTEGERETCEPVVCESTGVLEDRIRDRAAGA